MKLKLVDLLCFAIKFLLLDENFLSFFEEKIRNVVVVL